MLFCLFLSFSFISIKELIDLNFISLNIILLIYGLFGFIFCLLFCTAATFCSINSNKNNYIANFLFKVKEHNGTKSYIDNFKIYYELFNDEKLNKTNEIIILILSSFTYALYEFFTLKVIEDLTILHQIFTYSIYNFGLKITSIKFL